MPTSMKEIKQATAAYADIVQKLRNVKNTKEAKLRVIEQKLEEERNAIEHKYEKLLSDTRSEEREAYQALLALLEGAESLFTRPKTFTIDGVTVGFRKTRDRFVFTASEEETIMRIKAALPEQAAFLIETKESVRKSALDGLESFQRDQICVEAVAGKDEPIVKLADSNMQKFITEATR